MENEAKTSETYSVSQQKRLSREMIFTVQVNVDELIRSQATD